MIIIQVRFKLNLSRLLLSFDTCKTNLPPLLKANLDANIEIGMTRITFTTIGKFGNLKKLTLTL